MRMVSPSWSRFVRSCPRSFARLRHYAPQLFFDPRPRATLLCSATFIPANHPRRTTSTSSIDACATNELHTSHLDHSGPDDYDDSSLHYFLRIPDEVDFGKWKWLWRDKDRLKVEADVHNFEPDSDFDPVSRLVDQKENFNDAQLWLCILKFRLENDGLHGVFAVLEGLMMRGCLTTVTGSSARAFWRVILNAAPENEDMMQSVWAYAEWLYDKHNVRWRDFYPTVMSAFMRRRQRKEGLLWHLRLAQRFAPDAEGFVMLLKRFIADNDAERQRLLRAIYHTSNHHRAYDEIIPFLYAKGFGNEARKWRELLLCFEDLPHSQASRPFIRYLAGYYPETILRERELEIAGLTFPTSLGPTQPRRLGNPLGIRELIIGSQEQTLGMGTGTYNDELAAKYISTTWVSLDFAINSLFVFGISSIGPLALQAIAFREKYCEPLQQRIRQLEKGGIGTGDSSYAQALCHWVETIDRRMLKQLLRSDVHPGVFDNVELERNFLSSALSAENADQIQLAASVRLIATANLTREVANELLMVSLRRDDKLAALRILSSMNRSGFQPFQSTVDVISSHIVKKMSLSRSDGPVDASFYACVLSVLLHFRVTPSSPAIRMVVIHLVRQGRFDEIRVLVSDICKHYQSSPTLRVHKVNIPLVSREDGKNQYQTIAADLDMKNSFHPLQRIFDGSMKKRIIRRAFNMPYHMDTTSTTEGNVLHYTAGIRLLCYLRDHGVAMPITRIQKAIIHWLASFPRQLIQFCPRHLRSLLRGRGRREVILRAVKKEVDEVWGSPLLPTLGTLQRMYTWSRVRRLRDSVVHRHGILRAMEWLSPTSAAPVSRSTWAGKLIHGLLRGLGPRRDQTRIAALIGRQLRRLRSNHQKLLVTPVDSFEPLPPSQEVVGHVDVDKKPIHGFEAMEAMEPTPSSWSVGDHDGRKKTHAKGKGKPAHNTDEAINNLKPEVLRQGFAKEGKRLDSKEKPVKNNGQTVDTFEAVLLRQSPDDIEKPSKSKRKRAKSKRKKAANSKANTSVDSFEALILRQRVGD